MDMNIDMSSGDIEALRFDLGHKAPTLAVGAHKETRLRGLRNPDSLWLKKWMSLNIPDFEYTNLEPHPSAIAEPDK